MSPRQVLMLIGIWTMVFIFLGFPLRGEQVLALVTGCAVLVIAYRLPHASRPADERAIPFVEHKSISPEKLVEVDVIGDETGVDEVVVVTEQKIQEGDITNPDQHATV